MIAALGLPLVAITSPVDADELSDSFYSKDGIIYPHTGDSTQVIFHTPPHITDFLTPGSFLGVLPEDCKPASHGTIESFYICNHDLFLKPEVHNGLPVYQVIEMK
jgi:hypothetical protein